MGKLTDFLKGDAGATGGSDPATAGGHRSSNASATTGNSNSNITNSERVAERAGSTGSTGSERHRHSGRLNDNVDTTTNRRSTGEDINHGITGHHGRDREGGFDRDNDGLDDRATGNADRTVGANGDFGHKHSAGHPQKRDFDLSNAEHTHHNLAPVTHEQVRHHETEEVLREREREDHHHHIKHAVVPVHDKVVQDEQHHTHTHAPTRIDERHVNTGEDQSTFAAIGNKHKDSLHHHEGTREVVDLGEKVRTHEHHHVHNVVQPVIELETHDRHRKHTTIPIHHVTHQAPIVHDSVHHAALSKEDFLKRGGKLDSTLTHGQAGENVLASTECERKVDGPAEGLMEKLHLK